MTDLEPPVFRKSSASTDNDCVEVALLAGRGALVRDSKDGSVQAYDRGEWRAFLIGVKAGEFDLT